MIINPSIERMLIIAYSAGYEAGHHDTVESNYQGYTRQEDNDWHAKDWLDVAKHDGSLERETKLVAAD